MTELIDIKQLRNRLDGLKFHLEVSMKEMLNDNSLSTCRYVFGCVGEFIDELSKESVKVVKCKDCKHWSGNWCHGIPFNGDDAAYIETKQNDFCSYGERKENT